MGGPLAGVYASFGIAFFILLERTCCCCYRDKSFEEKDEERRNDYNRRGMATQARRERIARMSPREQLVMKSRL